MLLRRISSGTIIAAIALALFGISLQSACTHSARTDTIATTVGVVDTARKGFTAWDLDHQREIKNHATTREEAERDLATYRATTQHTILEAFTVAFQALAVAATQTDNISLTAALGAAKDLEDTIRSLLGKPSASLVPSQTPNINRRE